MLIASTANFFAVNLMTQANQLGLPATVALISYVQIFYSYLIDMLYFLISFTPMQYVGMLVTLGFMLAAALKKLFDERK
jgi:drug/metabolite transporter (DMT)-like permease